MFRPRQPCDRYGSLRAGDTLESGRWNVRDVQSDEVPGGSRFQLEVVTLSQIHVDGQLVARRKGRIQGMGRRYDT